MDNRHRYGTCRVRDGNAAARLFRFSSGTSIVGHDPKRVRPVGNLARVEDMRERQGGNSAHTAGVPVVLEPEVHSLYEPVLTV